MKLWLDDMREAPPGWIWAKDVSGAKGHLKSGLVEDFSTDHDLGAPPCNSGCWTDQGLTCVYPTCKCQCHSPYPDGSDLIRWMVEHNIWPLKTLTVHSQNPLGRRYIFGQMVRHAPGHLHPIGYSEP
jgi:hypothetical protein